MRKLDEPTSMVMAFAYVLTVLALCWAGIFVARLFVMIGD